MKKLPIFLLICLLIGIVACKETEDYWTQYEQWRETNESWFIEQLGAKDEKGNPMLTWKYAESHAMWGMIALFASGLALGIYDSKGQRIAPGETSEIGRAHV